MDEPIEKDDKIMPSTSKVELNIKAEPFDDYYIKEEQLESDLAQENLVELSEIKSEFSEPSDEYSNIQEFSEPVEHDNEQVQIEKPKMKIPQLITEALMNSPHGGLILSDIFKSISARHPYYTLKNKS